MGRAACRSTLVPLVETAGVWSVWSVPGGLMLSTREMKTGQKQVSVWPCCVTQTLRRVFISLSAGSRGPTVCFSYFFPL